MAKRTIIAMAVLAALILDIQFEIDVLKDDFIKSSAMPFVAPRAEWSKVAAIGHHTLIADMYWLRAIQYKEDMEERKEFPKDLYAMGEFITDLDPRYHLVYFFTGLNLIMEVGKRSEVTAILEKGEKNCPDYWKTPFLLGFYYFMVLQEYDKAADHIEVAHKINKHWMYGRLASKLRSQGGSPELGIKFLREMLKQTDNEKNIRLFNQRIRELETQIYYRDLTGLAQRYHRERGEHISRLDDLVAVGLIEKIPPHPLPGHLFIYDSATNQVASDPPFLLEVYDAWADLRPKKTGDSDAGEEEK